MRAEQRKELESRDSDFPAWMHEIYGNNPPDYAKEWEKPEPHPKGFGNLLLLVISLLGVIGLSIWMWVVYPGPK